MHRGEFQKIVEMKRRKGSDGDTSDDRLDATNSPNAPNARLSLIKDKSWSSESMFNSILYSNLSTEQIKIVQVPLNRNLCIIACPGSGKTSTLTARIIRSIIEKKKSVVCITFTNYAANDLKEKITKKVNCLIDLFLDADVRCKLFTDETSRKKCDTSSNIHSRTKLKVLHTVMFIGTIHSFCRYLLFKYKGPFKILTDFISSNVIKLAFSNFYASFLKGKSTQGVGGNCFGSGKDTGDDQKGSFDLLNFLNTLKEGFSKRDAQEIEDEAENEEGDDDNGEEDDRDDEDGDHFYNYLYHVNHANGQKDRFEHADIPSILKKKHILFLKKKIKLFKYVELYSLKVEMNPVEEKFYEEYKRILQSAKHIYYDFDDLLIETYRLMKGDLHIRDRILAEWNYMFCDEFQDINTTQFNILQFFANANCDGYSTGIGSSHRENHPNGEKHSSGSYEPDRGLTVIGDDDQSIYSFRGAHINVFDRIIKEHNCLLFKLGTNFRSTKEIVRVSCNLILHNASCRIEKQLQTNNVQGEKVNFHAFRTNNDQVSFILCQIIFLKKKYSYKFGDFVILSRTNRTLKETLKCMHSVDVRRRAVKFFHEMSKVEMHAAGCVSPGGDHPWTDVTPDTFKIPIKELNKKKSFFGSKEIVELITVLRFLLNVDDDIILKKAFKIIKNDKAVRGILEKLESSNVGRRAEDAEVSSTDTGGTDPYEESSPSLFNRIERISHWYILWKRNQLDGNEIHQLDIFTEEEIKKILDFFFCVNYFLKFASKANSVYSLVMEMLNKTGFVNRTLRRIRRRRGGQMEQPNQPDQPDQQYERRKRSFDECTGERDAGHADLVNELKIKQDLRTYFGLSEEDLAEQEMQNIFVLLEMTMEYKPNEINEKCSDCLISFLNDFKNDIHDRMLVEKVTLTTIHKSKGLEWKVVFIVNAMEGEIPQTAENNRDIIEERKIFYVGITRAKFFLYLLCFLQNNHTAERNTVSRFVSQMAI